MSKLYRIVAHTFVEAADEDEALDRFADDSWDFAANAKCYEACERFLIDKIGKSRIMGECEDDNSN